MFIYEKSILQSNEHQCSIHVCECFFSMFVFACVFVCMCVGPTLNTTHKQTVFNLIKLCFTAQENIFFLIK